ncbi:mediator complex, subunit Med7 [Xylariaceae sp. FL1272]|nr:mediator complex, subunit Med7 [Xylariaceae sp. FL1272]
MAEGERQASSTWPPPPFFWKSHTPENTARIDELRKQAAESSNVDDLSKIIVPNLPRDLRFLQPPAEPPNGEWRIFGDTYRLKDELPKLDDSQIKRLFPNPEERDQDGKHFDRATILKRLAKSSLLNFLELVARLATNPESAEEKITDIRDIFINMHHLINEYRPHQARESLISMMQSQLDRTRTETNTIRDAKDKAERVLEGLGSLSFAELPPISTNGRADDTQQYGAYEGSWDVLSGE